MSYRDDLVMKVATSNECELIALQYQALIELSEDLGESITKKDKSLSQQKLDKIREIIANLISTLTDDEFSQKTKSLYLYCVRVLNDQAIKHETDKISEIIKIFTELKDAWTKVGGNVKSEINKNISNVGIYGRNDIDVHGSLGDFGKA